MEAYAWPYAEKGDPYWPEVQIAFTPFTVGNDYGLITSYVLGIDKMVSVYVCVCVCVGGGYQ